MNLSCSVEPVARSGSATGRTLQLFWRGPALFHQREQMFHSFLITTAFFGGELFGALVELRGHVGGFFRRTTEGDEDLGKLGNFHG